MLALVAAWAFAEAILLVIVADVPISWIAVCRGWRHAATAALVAALAAAIGGAVVHQWAAGDQEAVRRLFVALPGIDAALIAEAELGFAAGGYRAMLAGSFAGTPYKLYALAAAADGRALLPFLLLSPLVRLPRFLAVALLAAGASRMLSRRLPMRMRLVLLASLWLVFYAGYFALMAG